MVATLANGYEGRDARLSESPQRQTRENPINVLGRFRLDHESQGNTTSNGSATPERLVRDELVEPRERRKDDLLDERPTCVRRRHLPGFHMVDFDQEKHETSRCVCLAPRPPRNRRAVYVAPGRFRQEGTRVCPSSMDAAAMSRFAQSARVQFRTARSSGRPDPSPASANGQGG